MSDTATSGQETAEFIWPVRVYYEDTDHGGVVYNANYLKFMERARTEWLRAKGIEQDVLIDELALIFAVRSVQLDFLKPARFNQLLAVSVRVLQAGKASVLVEQEVRLLDSKQLDNQQLDSEQLNNKHEGGEFGDLREYKVLCRGQVKIACLDASTLKPKAIPAPLRKEIFGDN